MQDGAGLGHLDVIALAVGSGLALQLVLGVLGAVLVLQRHFGHQHVGVVDPSLLLSEIIKSIIFYGRNA